MKRLAAAIALLLWPTLAAAQNPCPVPQGTIVAGHVAVWGTTRCILVDGGSAPATGTVTSVGLSMPSIFAVTGSPVTTAGTLAASLNPQAANRFFAGPASGADTTPTFRALVAADVPSTILPGSFSGFATCSVLIGLTAQAGTATTGVRSDGACALDQTIAPTMTARWIYSVNGAASTPAINLTGSWFTGGTATTTKPQFLIEPSGTTSTAWNTQGTGLGVNAPSGFTGTLLNLQLNGVSRFNVGSAGSVTIPNKATSMALPFSGGYLALGGNTAIYSDSNDSVGVTSSGYGFIIDALHGYTFILNGTGGGNPLGFNRSTNPTTLPDVFIASPAAGALQVYSNQAGSANGSLAASQLQLASGGTADVFYTRGGAAATHQLGATDAASPVGQTLQVQSVVAGTNNTAGVNWTLIGSLSTGSGASGDIILQTGGTGAGATSKNSATTALQIKGATQQVIASTSFMVGSATALTLTSGAIGVQKITASASAPGAAGAKFEVVCGTGAGTAKLVMYAGTSGTASTVVDNVGAGVTGC